jgi:hypothetical protein
LIALLSGVEKTAADGRKVSLIQYVIDRVGIHGWERYGAVADLIGIAFFAGLCLLLLREARKRLEV